MTVFGEIQKLQAQEANLSDRAKSVESVCYWGNSWAAVL
jgi:hypothetical protein